MYEKKEGGWTKAILDDQVVYIKNQDRNNWYVQIRNAAGHRISKILSKDSYQLVYASRHGEVIGIKLLKSA